MDCHFSTSCFMGMTTPISSSSNNHLPSTTTRPNKKRSVEESLLSGEYNNCFYGSGGGEYHHHGVSVLARPSPPTSTSTSTSSRRRKRVRFEVAAGTTTTKAAAAAATASDDQNDVSVEILAFIRPCSDMTPSEIETIWYKKDHLRQNLEHARMLAIEEQNRRSKYVLQQQQEYHQHQQHQEYQQDSFCCHSSETNTDDYVGAIESSFVACCFDPFEENLDLSDECASFISFASESRKRQLLSASASVSSCPSNTTTPNASSDDNVNNVNEDFYCIRGLEKAIVPMFGMETGRRRKEAITHVILAQYALQQQQQTTTSTAFQHPSWNNHHHDNHNNQRSELLREISEFQSRPARKFAKAMGGADAMSALYVYQEEEGEKDEESSLSSKNDSNVTTSATATPRIQAAITA